MKMSLLTLWLLLISSFSVAAPGRSDIEKLLPSELVEVLKNKSSQEAEKQFKKKIFKQEPSALYLNYFGRKGDTTLGLKDNKVVYVYAEVPESIQKEKSNLFAEVYDSLTPKEKENVLKKMNENTSHEKGRFIIIDLPSQSMKLEFYNDEKKTLRSILLWPLGGKLP